MIQFVVDIFFLMDFKAKKERKLNVDIETSADSPIAITLIVITVFNIIGLPNAFVEKQFGIYFWIGFANIDKGSHNVNT